MLIIQSTMSVKSSFLLVKSPSSVKSLFYRGQNNVMSTTPEVGMLSTIYRCLNKFMVMTFMGCLDNFFWFYHVYPHPWRNPFTVLVSHNQGRGSSRRFRLGYCRTGCTKAVLISHYWPMGWWKDTRGLNHGLPSGKRVHNYRRSPFWIGNSTIFIVYFQ